jgi:hypothetical protein
LVFYAQEMICRGSSYGKQRMTLDARHGPAAEVQHAAAHNDDTLQRTITEYREHST